MKKQYVIAEAYSGNYSILQYIDGKFECSNIVADYELSGYILALENMGYEEAYYEKECKLKIEYLEEALNKAKESYQSKQGCFLDLSADEAERYEKLTHFNEPNFL